MSAKYIALEPIGARLAPRCDLPGSPFSSRRQALMAARRAGIAGKHVAPVRRHV